MSQELELMYNSFLTNKVPDNWSKVGYLSLKPLGSWIKDFIEKVEFFK
jgi:dynein heavy chain